MRATEMDTRIAVLGAGSIGCYLGGALLGAGADVILIGRARMQARVRAHGLTLTDSSARSTVLAPEQVAFTDDPGALANAGLILITVKSADTDAAAALVALHAAPDAVVLSLQNGVGNVERLRAALPGRQVLAGMVPFNVVQLEETRMHRGTAGEVMVETTTALAPWEAAFAAAHLPLQQQADFVAVQWGKLLINLNNAINALAGIPLQAEFSQHGYRRCLALLIDEGRTVLQVAGIAPAKVVKLGPRLLPLVLRLPDIVFKRVAAPMLRIDPQARSSMWEDLEAGRRTEVDYLNGAVVSLAQSIGRSAPYNERMVALVCAAEAGQRAPISGERLYALLRARSF
jgi:2-dehydropantoate 2-reductase